jgi:hypothetical protein
MILVLVSLVLVNAFECNNLKCNTTLHNNPKGAYDMTCDLSCNTLPCHLDILTDELQEPLYQTFKLSDCYSSCLETCDVTDLINNVCDPSCSTAKCGFDLGKCGYCASGCKD